MKEEKPTRTKLIAAIIVVVVVIAAIGAAFAFGVFAPKEKPPVGGAIAVGDTTIGIGGSVKVNSTAKPVQKGATLVEWTWFWGDGTNSTGGKALTNATHTYLYGGFYWIYQVVKDSNDKTGSNEASMIRITVTYYDPMTVPEWGNATTPFAVISSDKDIVPENTLVKFNMTSTFGLEWSWVNNSNHSEGQNRNPATITAIHLDYGDGSPAVWVPISDFITAEHTYAKAGHYAATAVAYTMMVDPYGTYNTSTQVERTIHVLAPSGAAVSVRNPGTFIRATIGEPDFVDPSVDYETGGGEILQNVYETLVWYDGSSASKLVPLLASQIPTIANGGITSDGLNYTFHLRSNVKFHDGTTMTADDVIYSVQRVLRMHDPNGPSWMVEQVMSDYISYYIDLTVKDWQENTTHTIPAWLLNTLGSSDPSWVITNEDVKNASEAAAYKVDASTVTFRLTHPYPGFIYICAYTILSIVSKTFVEAHGGITDGGHNDYMDSHTCGTGPYQLVEWTKGSRLHMTKNANYWNATVFKTNAINDIYIVLATDVNTRILMMQSGDADSADMPIDFRSLFTGDSFHIDQGKPTFDITFAGFNFHIDTAAAASFGSDVPADFFADIHLRTAFVHLMNYAQFITNVLQNNAIQPNGPIPLGMLGFTSAVPNYTYSLALAEQEFKAAINTATGNSWWDDGFTVAFMYNAGNTQRETACTYVKTALEGLNAKFHATINALDWPTYLRLQRANPSPFPIFWLGWAPDYADPDDYCTPFLDSVFGSFAAKTGYTNTSMDALIRQAGSELDPATRLALYAQITWGTYYDVPYMWLYQSNNFHVERSWISGYYYNPMYSAFYYPQFTKG
jgi:peptide/nickel transport system substrate-binding protein